MRKWFVVLLALALVWGAVPAWAEGERADATVSLPGNPGAGEVWNCVLGTGKAVSLIGIDYVSDENADSAGGVFHYRFNAVAPGWEYVLFEREQSGEGGGRGEKRLFRFTVSEDGAVSYEEMPAGDAEIELEDNPSTGYGWVCEIADERVLTLAGTRYDSDAQAEGEMAPGVGGKTTFAFNGVAAGETDVTLTYKQDWAGGDAFETRTYRFTVSEDGSVSYVGTTEGDLRVELAGNPTTGYEWTCRIDDESVLRLLHVNYAPDSTDGGLVGAGGTYTFVFAKGAPGETDVLFLYAQNWGGGEDGEAQTRHYTVTEDGELLETTTIID